MENNKDINPDNSAISEQDSGVESISNIDTDFVDFADFITINVVETFVDDIKFR